MLEYGSVYEFNKIVVVVPVFRLHDMQKIPSYTKIKNNYKIVINRIRFFSFLYTFPHPTNNITHIYLVSQSSITSNP